MPEGKLTLNNLKQKFSKTRIGKEIICVYLGFHERHRQAKEVVYAKTTFTVWRGKRINFWKNGGDIK